jgi:hypothetical protein
MVRVSSSPIRFATSFNPCFPACVSTRSSISYTSPLLIVCVLLYN